MAKRKGADCSLDDPHRAMSGELIQGGKDRWIMATPIIV
jgi:hypothetical protein